MTEIIERRKSNEQETKSTAVNEVPTHCFINHDIMHCTAEGVVGNHLYSGRALGISNTGDIIQLHPGLKPHWKSITEHYKRVGLDFTEQVDWDLDLAKLAGHG